MEPVRIGILGCGRIAAKMARTVAGMPKTQAVLAAAASRTREKAEAFAAEYAIPKAYGSYEALLADREIDLVYIATPNSCHFANTMAALDAGKHVLCEKPFALNEAQAARMIDSAKEKGLFLMEAVWTRFQPLAETARRWLDEGLIGAPHMLYATFGGYALDKPRISEPALGGGAMLDLGIYTLTAASILFGDEMALQSTHAVLTPKGVDARSDSLYAYPDGRTAHLVSAVDSVTEAQVTVYGAEGYLKIDGISNWLALAAYGGEGRLLRKIDAPPQITGYEYEVAAACEAIRAGKLECDRMPHAQTLRMMRRMDELRARWGVVYPAE